MELAGLNLMILPHEMRDALPAELPAPRVFVENPRSKLRGIFPRKVFCLIFDSLAIAVQKSFLLTIAPNKVKIIFGLGMR